MSNYALMLLPVPMPCGLAVTSVTGDGKNLYALQPDRKTVYKLDQCGRIICTFKLSRRYSGIHYCGGRFYAVSDCSKNTIYILNKCLTETGSFAPDFPTENNSCSCCSKCAGDPVFTGPAGGCNDTGCMLTIATANNSYAITPGGRIISKLSSSGQNLYYTAIAENNGILYEGLESRYGNSNFVRATQLSTGQSKLQRLPAGYKARSFFCFDGRLYSFVTHNSYHGYIAAVCTYIYNGLLGGEIIALPDSSASENCCEESCNWSKKSNCTCSSGTASCGCVSSNQTELCNNAVSGESTDAYDCDTDELCRILNCIKNLCKSNCNSGGCNNCVGGCSSSCSGNCGNVNGGACCPNGTLNCTCFTQCECDDSETGGITCLPLPPCPPFNPPCEPCPPCEQNVADTSSTPCGCNGNLKVTLGNK